MKQVLEEFYKGMMHVINERIEENRCIICLEPLIRGEMVDHYQGEHRNLARKIFQVDFGDDSIVNSGLFPHDMFTKFTHGCRVCTGGGTDGGIVEHFSKRHPFIVRFLNKWNFKII